MIDPVKSMMIDVEEYWNQLEIGSEVTARHIYKEVIKDVEKNPNIHKLNVIGNFLNRQVKYSTAEKVSDRVVDPLYKKVSTESSRPKNKRFCDVINEAFAIEERISPPEFHLRYKNMNPKDPITKNYLNKLLFALERNKCIIKLKRGLYVKTRDISEQEMTFVTRFTKLKKVKEKPKVEILKATRVVPVNLPQVDGYATVKSQTLETYIKEIKDLKLIIRALQNELSEKDRFIKLLPRIDLPALDTEEYADLKQKYGIT